MKILHVTTSFKPAWETGGVNRVAYELSTNFAKQGHDVTVYTTDRGENRIDVQKNVPISVDGVKVYYFKNISNYFAQQKMAAPYYLPIIARKEIQTFDIIHIHEHRTSLSLIVANYAKKYGIPYIIQGHGSLPKNTGKGKMKGTFDLFWGYNILNSARNVIALNQEEAGLYHRMGVDERRIEVIPNGIDLAEYNHLPKKGVFKRKFGIRDDEQIILYLGRLDQSKGLDLLIKSFADLKNQIQNIRLIFIGQDAGYQDKLKELINRLNIENSVDFTGFVDHEDKLAAFTDADVFVTPRFTGFPITFLEACLCGASIITTRKGDELDWIDNRVGYVVNYNRKELEKAIFLILSNEKLKSEFEENGKEVVHKQFALPIWMKEIERVYEKRMEPSVHKVENGQSLKMTT